MKALISPLESFDYVYIARYEIVDAGTLRAIKMTVENCQRVAEVRDSEFEVAAPFFWVNCSDSVVADLWAYKNGEIIQLPENAQLPNTPVQEV
jgi:hypothetical protein